MAAIAVIIMVVVGVVVVIVVLAKGAVVVVPAVGMGVVVVVVVWLPSMASWWRECSTHCIGEWSSVCTGSPVEEDRWGQ